jgi:hypothetical protein
VGSVILPELMKWNRGPWIAAIATVTLFGGLWWVERATLKTHPATLSAPSGTLASGRPNADSTVTRATLDARIATLEKQFDSMTGDALADQLLALKTFGPKAAAAARDAVASRVANAPNTAPAGHISKSELLGALLEAEVDAEALELAQTTCADSPGATQALDVIARHLELCAMVQLRGRDPKSLPALGHWFTRGAMQLDSALRESKPLTREHWQLAQAVFRAAPFVRDTRLVSRIRRFFGRLGDAASLTDLASSSARLEALAASVMTGAVRGPDAAREIHRAAAALLHRTTDTPADGDGENAEHSAQAVSASLRALRLTRKVLFEPRSSSVE